MATASTPNPYHKTTALMREAAKKPLTPEQKRAQMVSFAMGMMGNDSTMGRKEVWEQLEEQYGVVER